MFTDEEKEYVLLAYYLGRKKLLNCIALQQLTKDILDVFNFESPIAICKGQKINPTAGCCLCKEKETIFKDFLEYYLLKDNATGCDEVHEKDVENVWADVSHLWKTLLQYDGHVSGRQLILNYEKAGEALMKRHNVKIYDYIKKKYGDFENLENWSRIISKVQGGLHSLHETLEKMCDSEAPVQSVHKVPNSAKSVRVAPITLNVQGNAPILAKYAMQCRTYGIEATAESQTSVRMKYMVCLKCSMENDYSQPISVMGLHSKYFTICQRMFLVFEKKLHINECSVESEKCTYFQTNTKNDELIPSSVIVQGSFPAKSTVKNLIDLTTKTVQTVPCSDQAFPVKAVNHFFTQPTSTLPIDLPPAHEEHDHILYKSPNKKVRKTRRGRPKHDRVTHVMEWPVRYNDDEFKHETLTETMSQLERFNAKFTKIHELKQVSGLQRHMPLPDMPIMTKFKVYRPAEGEPWPLCHSFPEDNCASNVTPVINTPVVINTVRCDLQISSCELFDDRDCTLFPEVDADICDIPSFGLSKSKGYASQHKIVGIPILTPFRLSEGDKGRRSCDVRLGAQVAQLTPSRKPLLTPEVNGVQTDTQEPDEDFHVSATSGTLKMESQETVEDFDQTILKKGDAVDGSCNTTSHIEPAVACNNCDDDNSNFRESHDSNEEASNDHGPGDSGSQSEFSIYVAEYLAKFVPDLDDTLKSFLARRQRLNKGKTEPSKLHFSHYLCSSNGPVMNEALSNEFSCSKMVRIGAPAKTLSRMFKSCEWVPKSLSRLTRLVLHEQILYHKQAVIDRRSAAKRIQKKTKSSRSRKWRYRANMKNRTKGVVCVSSLGHMPLTSGNTDSVQGNIVSEDARQYCNAEDEGSATLDQTPALGPESNSISYNISASDESKKFPVHQKISSSADIDHEIFQSGLELGQNFQSDVGKSDNFEPCSPSGFKSYPSSSGVCETIAEYGQSSEMVTEPDNGDCKWTMESPRSGKESHLDCAGPTSLCLPENISGFTSKAATSESSDALLRMRYKRDSDGNWKHVHFNKRNVTFNMQAKPLQFRSSMPRDTSVSEFHHKLSMISHHRPPRISKASNRNQSIVQNFVNSFRKSKDKRRKSMFNSCKSLLFSSSYLPTFEEIGFTAINPSPGVFAASPKLQQLSFYKRRKSLPDISRLLTKPHDIVAHRPVSNITGEILQQPSDRRKNLVAVTNRVENATATSSTATNLHRKFNSEPLCGNLNLYWNEQKKILRSDKLHYSFALISAKSAEFAVTALNLSLIPASTDDNIFTVACPSLYPHCHVNKLEYRNLTSGQENCAVAPTLTVTASGVIRGEKLQKPKGEGACTSETLGDLQSIIQTPMSQSEKTRQSLKLLDKSVMTASSNFECSYMTTEYKYHLSYESVLAIMGSIAQKCKPGNFYHGVTGSSKQMDWIGEKLWKSDGRLSMALKYCFASKHITPTNRRCSNKRIGKALVSCHKFYDRVSAKRLLKRTNLKPKQESKDMYHQYWWSIPSHDLYKKERAESFPTTRSRRTSTIYAKETLPSKVECDTSLKRKRRHGRTESQNSNDSSSKAMKLDFAQNIKYSRTCSRLKLLGKLDNDSSTKTIKKSNNRTHSCSDAKSNVDGRHFCESTSSCGNPRQSEMLRKVNRRKRKFDTTDSPLSHKQMRALMTADETNMKRYAQTGKTERNARCLQPLFESALNIHSVSRVLYDSANAKSFSLVPPEFTQNTPTVFELGNQSLSLLQVSENAPLQVDPKDGDKVKSGKSGRSAYVSLEQCPSATAKLGTTISIPHASYRRLPCLLRFKTRPCSPNGLSRAKRSRLSWNFDRRGRRPKNIGLRTPSSRSCSSIDLQPSGFNDETLLRLFGKIPVVLIPKYKI